MSTTSPDLPVRTPRSERLVLAETPLPAIGKAAFTEALSHFATSVWIVSAGEGKARRGRTVTSLMTVSAEPPRIAISIDADSDLARLIPRAGGFGLSLLAEDQRAIGDVFAGGLPSDERFSAGEWSAWDSGHPRLAGTVMDLDCTLAGTVEAASHLLFIGAVTAAQSRPLAPLIWHRRGYRALMGDQ